MTTDSWPIVGTLKALAHPLRLRILALLRGGELCVCEVAEVLEMAPSTVSEHLTGLRRTGLVREWKVGRWVHVALDERAAAWPVLESLWPLLATAQGDWALDLDRARALRCQSCGPAGCRGAAPSRPEMLASTS